MNLTVLETYNYYDGFVEGIIKLGDNILYAAATLPEFYFECAVLNAVDVYTFQEMKSSGDDFAKDRNKVLAGKPRIVLNLGPL